MCGIAGIYHRDPRQPIEPRRLVAMASVLYHRGPDGFGYHIVEDKGVGFSHARLSIIDLDEKRGRQPFLAQDGNLLLAQNGEFYDYKRIRADLTSRGARFVTKSDSELVLHLYPRFGLARMLEYLRGEFAFALYDRQKDRLILVRDRFGIKPLYWAETKSGIIFGSELKALFAHPSVERRFSPQGLYHQLMQTIVPGSTCFDHIQQVEPGHSVVFERRDGSFQIRSEKYWDMPFPQQAEHATEFDESTYIEGVRERLLQAVQLRLEADVPVACYLSGGIDSCSILGLAAACQQSSVKAFTIGFDDAAYDETPIAVQMAQSTKADQDILSLDAAALYDNFERTIWHTERSIYNTLGVAKLLMSQHVHQAGYKVVVTGEGSDELFAGYPGFRRDLFLYEAAAASGSSGQQREKNLMAQNELFQGAMLAEKEWTDPALEKLVGFTPSSLQPWLSTSPFVPSLIAPDMREKLKGYDPGAAIASRLDPQSLEGRHPLDKAQYVWIKTMLEGQILTWGGDRVDMANAMESRPAFLDHHLAEFAARVPPSLRIKGHVEKYVLREAMKGLLPEVLYRREKFAFMAPPSHTAPEKRAALQKLVAEYLSPQAIATAGLLNAKGVEAVFEEHKNPSTSAPKLRQLDAMINHLLCVQILHRNFVTKDFPGFALEQARKVGWSAEAPAQ